MTDVVSSVATPNQQLIGFQKVDVRCVTNLPLPPPASTDTPVSLQRWCFANYLYPRE